MSIFITYFLSPSDKPPHPKHCSSESHHGNLEDLCPTGQDAHAQDLLNAPFASLKHTQNTTDNAIQCGGAAVSSIPRKQLAV